MTLGDDLRKYAKATHDAQWTRRAGSKVPEADELGLGNEAVTLDGVVLYADLAESTALVKGFKDWFAAEVYKNYLYAAARIIRSNNGVVTAYDGDRVMGVYIGDSKNSDAARTALQINYAVKEILRPAIKAKYPNAKYTLQQKVGIDASPLFVARTGIRGAMTWSGSDRLRTTRRRWRPLRLRIPPISRRRSTGLSTRSRSSGVTPRRTCGQTSGRPPWDSGSTDRPTGGASRCRRTAG
jgi:class 3 adenylate cyclase